ncbi:SURF1 family protein [Arenibaculum pallidiluteum]|uniref:SURF1 family protein n=1 Tax=Arenibaculum pallidiluteum TaxID=2812559 RepID=UPI001A9627F8|nr:SURF1 family protein [Arenibaculum pallidiluteum]
MPAPTARRFRPSRRATLFMLPCLAILLGLGTWQVERLGWKRDLLARMDAQMAAPPVPLPAGIDDPAAWEYRPVTVTGAFRHDQTMPISARTLQGRLGYELVTPLDRPDGTTVLVNRGWVPLDRLAPDTRPGSEPAGEVTVRGLARLPVDPGWFRPAADPARNTWFAVDLQAMAARIGRPVAPVYVDAAAAPAPEALPVGGRTIIDVPNNHLQYALTWYGLAVVLLAVYAISQRRRPEENSP